MLLLNLRVELLSSPYHINCDHFLPYFVSQCLSCSFTAPPVPETFSFELVQVTEQHVLLRWSELSPLNSLNLSSFEIFLQYQEEADGQSGQDEGHRIRKSEDKKQTQSLSGIRKIVRVPIFLSSREVTVTGLSPGSVYSFTLLASLPSGSTWNLGQTLTAYTSESADSRKVLRQRHMVTDVTLTFFFSFLQDLSPLKISLSAPVRPVRSVSTGC